MAQDMGRGIIAPERNESIRNGAYEMRTIAQTTASALNDLDRQVSSKVGNLENLAGVNTNDIRVWRQATAEIQSKIDQIEQNLEPGEDGKDGDPGLPGPGGSIALEETDPGCFVDSEITWMQWPESGGLPAVWNPNTQSYENPIRVDTTVGTRVFVGDTMIHGDTGVRSATERITPAPTGGWLRIRRVGNLVEIRSNALSVPASGTTLIGNIPSGFRPIGIAYFKAIPYWGSETSETARIVANGDFTVLSMTTTNAMNFHIMYYTSNPWPTSLPGTPA